MNKKNLVRGLTLLTLSTAAMAEAAGTYTGGRDRDPRSRPGHGPVNMPALECSLRQPSRAALVIRTSASSAEDVSSYEIYESGPADGLIRTGGGTAPWSSGGNSELLQDGDFALRVFTSPASSDEKLYATYERNGSGQLTLMFCSPAAQR